MNIKLFTAIASLMLSLSLFAQPQGFEGRPGHAGPPKMKTPAERATLKADLMQKEVNLSQKQYKKVYKLFKKDFEYREEAMQDRMPGGFPPEGMEGGRPPMGGGPGGMGGGRPPMGGGPGMGGGRPPMGGGPGMGGPQMGTPGDMAVTEEYLEKQDAKLRKILSEDQYRQWRSKHPAERLALPPIQLDK